VLCLAGCGSDESNSGAQVEYRPPPSTESKSVEQHASQPKPHPKQKEGSGGGHARPPGLSTITAELHEELSGNALTQFQIAYDTCSSEPQAQLAKEWGVENEPTSIAHAFGNEYMIEVHEAVEEGCLRALSDSTSQQHAEIEAWSEL
jgi:hypothetical protein